jgi:hypothetical protein
MTESTTERQKQSVKREINTTWTDGSNTFELKARNVEISDDGKEISPLGDAADAYLFVKEDRQGVVRRVEFVRASGGEMIPTYRVGGKTREFDAEARAWLAGVLMKFIKNSDRERARASL